MKLGPVTKLDNRNKITSKNIDDDVISANCDVIVIFLINDRFGAIRKTDSGRLVCKTYVFFRSNLLSYKNSKKKTKKSLTQFSHYCFELRYHFYKKNAEFLQKKCRHNQN